MKMLSGLLSKQNTKLLCAVLVAYVVVDLSGYVLGDKDGMPAIVEAVKGVWPPTVKKVGVLVAAAALAYMVHECC